MLLRTDWTASKSAVLTRGRYQEPAAPGSVSQVVITLLDTSARGVVDGRETAAAVISTTGGGSGTFFDLVLLVREPGGWKHADTSLLGDRVKVHSLSFAGREIIVDLTEQGPNDPMCCPTLRHAKRYTIQHGRFRAP